MAWARSGTATETETPEWLTDLISTLENEPPGNPPMSITRYAYKEQTVYFQTAPCCDIFSNLYDADGNIIGHPDGGITGQGDGRDRDAPPGGWCRGWSRPLARWKSVVLPAPLGPIRPTDSPR